MDLIKNLINFLKNEEKAFIIYLAKGGVHQKKILSRFDYPRLL